MKYLAIIFTPLIWHWPTFDDYDFEVALRAGPFSICWHR